MEKLAQMIIDNPSGGTADIGGLTLPESGFFVGGAGAALVFPEGGADHYLIVQYLLRAQTRYIGWWTDRETGRLYVDQSDWFEQGWFAEGIARTRHEIAYWDIAHGREIRTEA